MNKGCSVIMKKVSVAMAVYNGEKFLRKQLDSICNQTYQNIEIIAVDDGSTDDSVRILREYHGKYGLIFHINKKNLGYLKNFEKALSFCTGDFIAFADQDDIWLPEKIERLVKEIGENSLIYSDAKIIDENDQIIHDSISEYTKTGNLPSEKDQFKKAVFYWIALGCMMLFKKELLEELIPFSNDGTAHDRQVSILAARKSKIKSLKAPLILYRLHSNNSFGVAKGSMMREFSPRYLFPWESEIKRIKFYLENKYHSNEEDLLFLNDIMEYYQSKMKKGLTIKAMQVAFKYKKLIFNDFNFLEKIMLVFGNILYFNKIYLIIFNNKNKK
jgi:glycosyltransferase involved in cell wall biosynthesis